MEHSEALDEAKKHGVDDELNIKNPMAPGEMKWLQYGLEKK